jgi:hypothetical protein
VHNVPLPPVGKLCCPIHTACTAVVLPCTVGPRAHHAQQYSPLNASCLLLLLLLLSASQALLVSLLPFDLLETASAAASSEDPLARTWLPKLLHWFHSTFNLTAQPTQPQQQQQQHAGPSSSRGAGTSSRRQARGWDVLEDLGLGFAGGSVREQLLACVSARSGSSTQLATLLVALLRAVGLLTRSVW